MPYLCDFFKIHPKDEIPQEFAALKVDFWYSLDIPPDQREGYPIPGTFELDNSFYPSSASPRPKDGIPQRRLKRLSISERLKRADGTFDDHMIFLRTRLVIIRDLSEVDERLDETDADIQKRNNFMKSITTTSESPVDFDSAALKYSRRRWTAKPLA